MGEPMRNRAQLKDGLTDVRVLMSHLMETGLRKDSAGMTTPTLYIDDVKTMSSGRTLLTARSGQTILQKLCLQFRLKGAMAGDKVIVTWTDNTGDTRTDDAVIV